MKLRDWLIVLFAGLILIFTTLFLIGFFNPQNAAFSINSNPRSTVYINGTRVGFTPYEGTRKAAEVTVRLIPQAGASPLAPYETKITLASGIKTVIRRDFGDTDETSSGEVVSFEKGAGGEVSLSVISIPDSAQVSLDGVSKGFAPVKTSKVSAGQHQLAVSAPGYTERTLTVQTYSGYKLTAFIKLAASLQPSSSPTPVPEVKKTYVEILSTPTGFLRVRDNPATTGAEVGQVKPGEKYVLVEEDSASGWFKIEYATGKSGWVTNQYTKKIEETATPTPR
jgi:hypothetical protein